MRFWVTLYAVCLLIALGGCEHQQHPLLTSAEIESVGVLAIQAKKPAAIAKLERWAQEGHCVAQRELALAYSSSASRWPEAVLWFQKAAQGGDREAQFELANAYLNAKLGLLQDYTQAWTFYEKASIQGDGKASFMLARMARHGWGVMPSAEKSAQWLMQASHQENAQAMYELSVAFAQGDGLPRDPIKSQYWLNMSADYDYKIAMQALALQLDGLGGKDSISSEHSRLLLKEASDPRLMNWNTNL